MTPRVRRYILDAAERHDVSPEAVAGRSRRPNACAARAEVMCRLRWQDGFKVTQIGRWMQRDHTTVIHATRGHH